ncbi:hypothetical protein Tco_1452000 [Tanacetum coccineum]
MFLNRKLLCSKETRYEENKEDEAHSKEHQKRDAKALFFIHQAVDDYQGSSKVITVKLQSLRREFETSSMKNNESVQEFLARVSSVVGQMRSYGDQIMDEIVVAKAHESRIKRSFIKEEEKAFQTKGDLGDDNGLKVEGHGTAEILVGNNTKLIKEVQFAPSLAHNLLSVGQLNESGYIVIFDDGECMVKKQSYW